MLQVATADGPVELQVLLRRAHNAHGLFAGGVDFAVVLGPQVDLRCHAADGRVCGVGVPVFIDAALGDLDQVVGYAVEALQGVEQRHILEEFAVGADEVDAGCGDGIVEDEVVGEGVAAGVFAGVGF